MVHQVDLIAQAYSMEHDQLLSAQASDCEKLLARLYQKYALDESILEGLEEKYIAVAEAESSACFYAAEQLVGTQ